MESNRSDYIESTPTLAKSLSSTSEIYGKFYPLDDENIKIIRPFTKVCPRIADILLFRSRNQLSLRAPKSWNYNNINTWIFPFEAKEINPACGNKHRSNQGYIKYQLLDITSPYELSTPGTYIKELEYISGYGNLTVHCNDDECKFKKVNIPYYYQNNPFNTIIYELPPDVLHQIYSKVHKNKALSWLIDRLCGKRSIYRRIVFYTHNKKWYTWNGQIWAIAEKIEEKLSILTSTYIHKALDKLHAINSAELSSQNLSLLLMMKVALANFEKFASNPKNNLTALSTSAYSVNIGTFDSLESKGFIALQDGYVDLAKGELIPPDCVKFMSQQLFFYLNDRKISTLTSKDWPEVNDFLNSILDDRNSKEKKEIISDLQNFLGYALTGEASDHVILFLYGSGHNGKGVLVNALKALFRNSKISDNNRNFFLESNELEHDDALKNFKVKKPRIVDYHVSQSNDPFNNNCLFAIINKDVIVKTMMNSANSHHSHRVPLIGCRIGIINEVNGAEVLDLTLLKEVCSTDSLNIRDLKKDEVQIIPIHTLICSTNVMATIHPTPALKNRIKILKVGLEFKDIKPGETLKKYQRIKDGRIETKTTKIEFLDQLLMFLLKGAYNFYQNDRKLTWSLTSDIEMNNYWASCDKFAEVIEEEFETEEVDNYSKILILLQRNFYIMASTFNSILKKSLLKRGAIDHYQPNEIAERLRKEFKIEKVKLSKYKLDNLKNKRGYAYVGLRILKEERF